MTLKERDLIVLEIPIRWLVKLDHDISPGELRRQFDAVNFFEHVSKEDDSLNGCIWAAPVVKIQDMDVIDCGLDAPSIALEAPHESVKSAWDFFTSKNHSLVFDKLRPED